MPRVVCLGEILVDRISDDLSADVNDPQQWQEYAGGAVANVAVNLAKLGVSVGLIGCVGQDQQGKFLREFLQGQGVDVTGLHTIPFAQTRQVYVVRDPTGERFFIKTTGNADLYLSPHHLRPDYFREAEYLVLGTVSLANPQPSRAVGRALKLAEENYVKVVVDINWRELFWEQPSQAPTLINILIKHADFLQATAEEARKFFRTSSPAAIAQLFHHLEGVIITEGAKGCRYYLGGRQSLCPAPSVAVVDTTGAGDAFLAGFLAGLCQYHLPDLDKPEVAHKIIQIATATGAMAVTTVGSIHPDLSWSKVVQAVS
ncbi:MAG: carbohydrate kinase family protein [Pseudanabaenaceae cyanobacterium]